MAARTIANWKDRLATIMVAPLMTCSARLPVYALLIGAFVPERDVGWFSLLGLTLFVFAPQCLSTLAVVRRETNSWRYPLFMAAYLFALAYASAFVTYRVTLWLGA